MTTKIRNKHKKIRYQFGKKKKIYIFIPFGFSSFFYSRPSFAPLRPLQIFPWDKEH